jgi:hypothetical protein
VLELSNEVKKLKENLESTLIVFDKLVQELEGMDVGDH